MTMIVGVSADGTYKHERLSSGSGTNSYSVEFVGWAYPAVVCGNPAAPISRGCSPLIHAEQATFDCPGGQIVGFNLVDDMSNEGPDDFGLGDVGLTTELPEKE